MTFSMSVPLPEPPAPEAEPTASRLCEFGLVEVIHVGSRWHWRLGGCREWSRVSHITMMDAYQGASFHRFVTVKQA